MASSLFGGQNQNGFALNPQVPNNQMSSFMEFAKTFKQSGFNPATIGQQMVNSGRISQEQLAQFGAIADKLVGRRR